MVAFLVVHEKALMGGLAVLIMLVAYGWQFWKTWIGISEPHPITWYGFGFLTGIGYLVQIREGAGSGSWVMGLTAIFCFMVGGLSQYVKHWTWKDFDGWDWTSLGLGIGLFVLYLICKHWSWGAVTSAILATSADLVLYTPTFKKAWLQPDKETGMAYFLNSIKFIPSLFAMGSYSVATCLYPIAMIIINMIVVAYLKWRRQCLASESS